ncbi:MAG: flagellar hook-basal body protein [Myxococcota bacterium]
MSRDIYPSLSGASATWQHLEVLANNIANTATSGFKAHRATFENVMNDQGLLGDGHVRTDYSVQDFSDGMLVEDQNPTHFALRGRGFFAVESAFGPMLQRSGAFSLDAQGFLVTAEGDRVLGENGPIQIRDELRDGGELVVAQDGTLSADGTIIDTLQLMDGANLEPVGASRWRARDGMLPADNVTVVQGALEGSNADPIRGMTRLIETSRYFEMYQKAMQTSDELDRRNLQIAERA